MPVTITDNGAFAKLAQEIATFDTRFKPKAKVRVDSTSKTIRRRVKVRMPWDTGRASLAWGTFPSIVNPSNWSARYKRLNPQSASDGIWEEQDGGLTRVQGTTVPYVEFLNEGSSKQAPAGFIDTEAVFGMTIFEPGIVEDFINSF